MRGLLALILLALLVAAGAATATPKRPPRFAVSITGKQSFDWTIDSPGQCAFEGHGTQVVEFATKPGLTAFATENWSPPGGPGGKEFRLDMGGKIGPRLLPLRGTESRVYENIQPTTCQLGPSRAYGQSCRGTNPFETGAGVVLLRNGQRLEVHVPVDVLLYERRPASCDLLLFDLRNSMISQLMNYGAFAPARGGNLVTFTGSRVVTATGRRVFCVDERDSDESGAGYRGCERPPTTTRGTVVTGKLTVDWTITLRRL